MALVQFENSPSTNTPINATNLNNNFNELNNKIAINKIYESSVSSWNNGNLGIDISNYDFLLLVSSHQTSFVPAWFDIYLTWSGWLNEFSKDGVTQRHIYRNGNDISWNVCWYRGINSYTGAEEIDSIDTPRAVYGIKIN